MAQRRAWRAFGGLLRTRGAGLLHPATDHGVRLVAGLRPIRVPSRRLQGRSRAPPGGGSRRASISGGSGGRRPAALAGVGWSVRAPGTEVLAARVGRCATSTRSGPKTRLPSPAGIDVGAEATGSTRADLRGSRRRSAASRSRCGPPLLLCPPAPFPQARSPFGAFPSSTAVPRHRGRCPLDVPGVRSDLRLLLPASAVLSVRPASPGPCSMSESVAACPLARGLQPDAPLGFPLCPRR